MSGVPAAPEIAATIDGGSSACKSVAADTAASTERESAVQWLSWRSFAVCQNFGDRRRKVINAGTGHDDAVAAAVSFLGDAQESPAVVLAELHVEMLALDLQFSRLDDVIHFPLKGPTLPHSFWGMEEKSAGFVQILWVLDMAGHPALATVCWSFGSQANR